MKIWIIGAGAIAIEYAKIFNELGHELTIIGRGEDSAKKFFEETGIKAISGGVENYCASTNQIPDAAVVAVSVDQLYESTIALIRKGCKKILTEKPGATEFRQVDDLYDLATENNARVYLAYNRRFYPPVREAIRIINNDGGLLSFHFEFTEWAFKIEPLPIPIPIKNNWFFANSTHVVDLAFFVGGNPVQFNAFSQGKLSWHDPSNFAGAGVTEKSALFTYRANWEAPGRWGVEFLTRNRKIILQPLEELKIMNKGSVAIEEFKIEIDPIESKYKPGFWAQVVDFCSATPTLKTIGEHRKSVHEIYSKIINGNK